MIVYDVSYPIWLKSNWLCPNKMSDYIATLPVDDDPVPPDERHLVDALFVGKNTSMGNLLKDLKQPVIAGILFALLSNSTVTQVIRDAVPYAKSSEMSLLLFKTFLFVVLLYLYNNLHLVTRAR